MTLGWDEFDVASLAPLSLRLVAKGGTQEVESATFESNLADGSGSGQASMWPRCWDGIRLVSLQRL